MPRPPAPAGTALGLAIRQQRASLTQAEIAEQLGVVPLTLSRLERGTHRPSADTAVKLAKWLGWTVERVMEAASQPAGSSDA